VDRAKRMQPFNCIVYVLQMANAGLLKEYADNDEKIYFIFKTARIEDQSKLQRHLNS